MQVHGDVVVQATKHFTDGTKVVQVAMRHHNGLQSKATGGNARQNSRCVTAGIHQKRTVVMVCYCPRAVAIVEACTVWRELSQEHTIARKRSDWNAAHKGAHTLPTCTHPVPYHP